MSRILFVGSDEDFATSFVGILKNEIKDCDVILLKNGSDAIQKIKSNPDQYFDVAAVEYKLPDMNGIYFFGELKKLDIRLPGLIILEKGMETFAIEALDAGAKDFVVKDETGYFVKLLPAHLMKIIINSHDCYARLKVEAALRETEEKFQKVYMLSPNSIAITTLEEGRIIEINDAGLKNFGFTREMLIGKTIPELGIISSQSRARIKALITEHGFLRNFEIQMRTCSGENRICLLSSQRITLGGVECLIHNIIDITERKKMEKELLKSKNLESIGILAGGIAREFNNYLTSIMGNISIAKLSLHDAEKIHRSLNRAEDISLKAAELAVKLLTFSEGGDPIYKRISITSIIREVVDNDFPSSPVQFQYFKDSGIWEVNGDDIQLRQIISSLLRNSVEAMPNGGTVTINVRNVTLPEENEFGLTKGPYVKVTATDTGVGIPENHLDKIFDPFFSTKDFSFESGLGMGLAICQSIVKKHNGHISISSEPGQGATVTLLVPAIEE